MYAYVCLRARACTRTCAYARGLRLLLSFLLSIRRLFCSRFQWVILWIPEGWGEYPEGWGEFSRVYPEGWGASRGIDYIPARVRFSV